VTAEDPLFTWASDQGLLGLDPEPEPVTPAEHLAVSELLNRYALGYDERRLDLITSAFTVDAVCETWLRETRVSRFEGAQAISTEMASVMREQGPAQRRHLVTNLIVTRDGDDLRGVAYSAVLLAPGPEEVHVGASAVYDLVATDDAGALRLSRLTIGLDGYLGHAPRR